MIRIVAYQKVDMTDQEFDFYKKIVKQYSSDNFNASDYFIDLFETDKDGVITIIKPLKSMPWSILFFVQNLMINQQLRSYDKRIKDIESKLK